MVAKRFISRIMAMAFAIPMLIATSCEDIGSNLDPIPGYEYESVSPKAVAEALAHLHPDKEICEEVHSAVRASVALGLDESYYFAEVFGGDERISKTAKIGRSLQAKLESLPTGHSIKELFTLIGEDTYYMNHYQIYWPYSEKWDGNTKPTITFQSEAGVPQDKGVGYRILNDRIEEVSVDEEYAKTHPVWIINHTPIAYEEYPDFAVRNWTHEDKKIELGISERIIYYANAYVQGSKNNPKLPDYVYDLNEIDFENDTLSLYLKNIHLSLNDESKSLFSGSIHYIFNIAVNDEVDAGISDFKNFSISDIYNIEGEIVSIRFTLLRSEIKPSIIVLSLHTLLSWNWQCVEEYSWYELQQEIARLELQESILHISYKSSEVGFYDSEIYLTDVSNKQLTYSTICRATLQKIPIPADWEDKDLIPVEFGVTKGKTTPPWHTENVK